MRKIIFCLLSCFFFSDTTGWCNDYVIGDGDGLSISVWGVPDLSVSVIVRPDGKITLPAVGDVVASGLTPVELSKELTKVLDAYVKTPIVTVTVATITNNRIYLSGGGVPPHVINLNTRTSLFKFLCEVDGISNVDLQRSYLMRNGERLAIDVYDLFINGNLKLDVDLQAEDILFLPTNELNKIYVVGAVNAPQPFLYREGMRILDVILASGGFTKFAKANAVLILRKNGNERQKIKLNMDDLMKDGQLSENIELQRGDYILVRESLF